MELRQWEKHLHPENNHGGSFTLGEKIQSFPDDTIISITLGENFSFFRNVVSKIIFHFVMQQLSKQRDLIYAELSHDFKGGFGQTLTVWRRQSLIDFLEKPVHHYAYRFISWFFFNGKAQSYFLTYVPINRRIPNFEEANLLVRTYGRHFNGGQLIRSQRKPILSFESSLFDQSDKSHLN